MASLRRFVKLEWGRVPKARFDRSVPAHVAYVKRLQREGRFAESGYWTTRPPRQALKAGRGSGPVPVVMKGGAGGMMVFEAKNLREARTIVAKDPLVANRLVTYELREWKLVVARPTTRRR